MGGGKLPPRQKMIGMMYLVLLALLAMNMSKDILNAFVQIGDSLIVTNKTFESKNEAQYSAFERAKAENPVKVTPYFNKAMEVKKMSQDLVTHIEKLKVFLMRAVDGIPETTPDDSITIHKLNSKDNYDVPTHILIGSAEAPIDGPNTAKELQTMVEDYKAKLYGMFDEKVRKNMNLGLELASRTENGVEQPWGVVTFDHLPIAPVTTILTKIQTDVRNAESDVIKQLFANVDAGDFKFDVVTAKVIPNTNYVLLGDSFKADVFVAAYSSTQNPDIFVGDLDTATLEFKGAKDSVRVKNGLGKYGVRPGAEGLQTYKGVINLKAPDGSLKQYPFMGEYMVAKPALVVSPTAMNVLYIGVDNPIEISVPGVAAENLQPSLSGGSLTGGKGKYVARVNGGTEAIVSVSAKMGEKNAPMGTFKFRVKRVPDPVAKFAGIKGGGNVQKTMLVNAAGVIAEMENFDFDLKVEVVSFDITANIGGFEKSESSNSKLVTAAQKTLMNAVKQGGGKVYIENVKARMPDGSIRSLGTISLKVI